MTIWAGEVVVVEGGGAAVVEGAVVGAGAGAVPVVVIGPGGVAPPWSGVCGRAPRWAPVPELARALFGPATDPMAAAWALSRATPTLWAAAAAPQIITTGLVVATALIARTAMRDRAPEITCSQFAVARR
jgi:hypothetical protein